MLLILKVTIKNNYKDTEWIHFPEWWNLICIWVKTKWYIFSGSQFKSFDSYKIKGVWKLNSFHLISPTNYTRKVNLMHIEMILT